MKDNIAWMVELFLLVIVLAGALGLGIVGTRSDSTVAGVIGAVLFVVCIVCGLFFTTGQDERLRSTLFAIYTVLTLILFTFYLTLAGVDLDIFSGLLG